MDPGVMVDVGDASLLVGKVTQRKLDTNPNS